MLNKLNFKIGHYKNYTVILCPNGTIGSYYCSGYALNFVNALILTGCSAFGLIRKRK
ncbi:MAG: hypothetical protein ACO2O6_05010 [Candidatus Hydrothermia bacterium]|jgi:hypothetical protein